MKPGDFGSNPESWQAWLWYWTCMHNMYYCCWLMMTKCVCVVTLQTPGLFTGTYDEAESAASFQEALQAWRNSDATKPAQHAAACLCFIISLLFFLYVPLLCLQCFDTAVQTVCIWSSWCHCIPKPHSLLLHINPDFLYLSGTGLPKLSWKKAVKRV